MTVQNDISANPTTAPTTVFKDTELTNLASKKASKFEQNVGAAPKADAVTIVRTPAKSLEAFVGNYERAGQGYDKFLRVTLNGGRLRTEGVQDLDKSSYSVVAFGHIDGPEQTSSFRAYEGQGNGTSTTKTTFAEGTVRSEQVTFESWSALSTLFGALPEKCVEVKTVELVGDRLTTFRSRRYFHKQFGLWGDYTREFTARSGNTINAMIGEFRKISE